MRRQLALLARNVDTAYSTPTELAGRDGTARLCRTTRVVKRRHLALLVVGELRFAHEIRSPNDLDLPKAGEGWTKKEMDSRPPTYRYTR